MRIVVCGQGKIGRPLKDVLRSAGHEVVGYDVVAERSDITLANARTFLGTEGPSVVIYIVPTPSLADGSFDNTYLEAALTEFVGWPSLHVISSTTTPGSCARFSKTFGIHRLCYKPEFIRLEHVREDLVNPAFLMIGTNDWLSAGMCASIYKPVIANVPVKILTLTEAELAKITLNCALTMKISLANQLWLVAQQLGCDAGAIMEAVGSDPRIGAAYLRPGEPYGGPCLPRDNGMFQAVAKGVGVTADLSIAADVINEKVKKCRA